ncbi:MAG: hypothetical protein QW785_00805 [Candidatus Anstonellales archaeon]
MIDQNAIKNLIIKLHELIDGENSRGLEKIDETIYKQAQNILQELSKYRDIDVVYNRQYQIIYESFSKLIRIRMAKIGMMVLNDRELFKESLTEEEYRFYQAMKELISEYRSKFLDVKKTVKVEITQDIQEYFDISGNKRGPYKVGEIIEIEPEEAEWMVSEGKARRLD